MERDPEEFAEKYDLERRLRGFHGFLGVTFRSALGLFPLLFSLNTVYLSPPRPVWQVALAAALLAVPLGLEFTFSDRHVGMLEQYVVGVILLWLVATAAGFGAGLLGATSGQVELVRVVFVVEGYVLSYLIVYRGWGLAIQQAFGT